mgnify:CR=1 FL=1
MNIDDMFRDMMMLMLMDEIVRNGLPKEVGSSEKINIDMDEILKAEKMYD